MVRPLLLSALVLAGCGKTPEQPVEHVDPRVETGSSPSAASPTASPEGETSGEQASSEEADAAEAGDPLFVDAQRVDCEGGAGPMKCLRVRRSADGEWELFYDEIAGFEHVPGTRYELRIKTSDNADPPADGSSIRYTLLRVLSEERVAEE